MAFSGTEPIGSSICLNVQVLSSHLLGGVDGRFVQADHPFLDRITVAANDLAEGIPMSSWTIRALASAVVPSLRCFAR
ncbi:hypothetical protein [Bradyrhizobium sp. AS23.2]|uniref:hypothetical protein n=1 Tax=Bradyrhizobium sp. AS23.2 TaxID=1680155 RepID=UPI00093BB353|nr:hypothetical protein [Bradyrhizobium sp. AS23.2]OKO86163.1 hypothetical protein AC630_03765 [Bradyrhizobium sp. AS23.2]